MHAEAERTDRRKKERLGPLGYDKDKHTLQCMMKSTRHVYLSLKSGISGVYYIKSRDKRRVVITYKQHTYHLGMFKTKEEAIRARVTGEKKYWGKQASV